MKKAIIASLATTVFFIVGIAATYFAMPMISPELVERAQVRIDSIRMVKNGTYPDSLLNPEDESPIDTSMLAKPLNTMLAGLRDSVQTVHTSLDNEMATKEALIAKIEELEQRWQTLQTKYDEAKHMSDTLTKLEDNELKALLTNLQPDVIESLYLESSARNRTRLLQMLPSDKAAQLVSSLASPSQPFATGAVSTSLPNQ